MAKAKYSSTPNGQDEFVKIFCPGCNGEHHLQIKHIETDPRRPVWGFNNDLNSPTFTPSLLVRTGVHVEGDNYKERLPEADHEWYLKESKICHSFITNGNIQFLGDSTHALAGQTVELPELKS